MKQFILAVMMLFVLTPAFAMNKAELIDAMASDANLSKADAKRALDGFISSTEGALKKGDRVALVGFGSFSTSKRHNGTTTVDFEVAKTRANEVIPRYYQYYLSSVAFLITDEVTKVPLDNAATKAARADIGDPVLRFAPLHAFFTKSMVPLSRCQTSLTVGKLLKEEFKKCISEPLVRTVDSFFDIWTEVSVDDRDGAPVELVKQMLSTGFSDLSEEIMMIDSMKSDVDESGRKTLTLDKMMKKISRRAKLSLEDTNRVIDSFFDIIYEVSASGDKVNIAGFGSFSISKRAARTGRNPQTGKEIKIAAKKVVRFKAGADLSKKVN